MPEFFVSIFWMDEVAKYVEGNIMYFDMQKSLLQ